MVKIEHALRNLTGRPIRACSSTVDDNARNEYHPVLPEFLSIIQLETRWVLVIRLANVGHSNGETRRKSTKFPKRIPVVSHHCLHKRPSAIRMASFYNPSSGSLPKIFCCDSRSNLLSTAWTGGNKRAVDLLGSSLKNIGNNAKPARQASFADPSNCSFFLLGIGVSDECRSGWEMNWTSL